MCQSVTIIVSTCNSSGDQRRSKSPSPSHTLSTTLPTILQTRHHDWTILDDVPVRALALDHKIRRETQPAAATVHVRPAKGTVDDLGVVDDDGDVVPPRHQAAVAHGLACHVVREDLHHVFFRVRGLRGRGSVAVGGDV